MNLNNVRIGIIGLGYVGLPLAIEFSKHYPVIGYDINQSRIVDLQNSVDKTGEVTSSELLKTTTEFTAEADDLRLCNVFIITVPTPVNDANQPDLSPLIGASNTVSNYLKRDNVVIYESTVYPGATEEVCVPILESNSRLVFNKDFYVGYSPERINPGDPDRNVTDILKVVSGSTPNAAFFIDTLYRTIITAGTYKAESIKVAEAAKVIENTQRDVNIALINELAMIFNKMDIDTESVLKAAGTKWNFLPFRPGLVGGHCQIGSEFITVQTDIGIRQTTFEDFINSTKFNEVKKDGYSLLYPLSPVKTLSFSPFTEEVKFKNVAVFSKRKYNKLISIKTELNTELVTSNKHPHIVKKDEQYNVVLADNLKIGDKIPLITTLPILHKNISINLIDMFKDNTALINSISVKINNHKWADFTQYINQDRLGVEVSNFNYWDYLPLNLYLKIREDINQEIDESLLTLLTGKDPSFSTIPAKLECNSNLARLLGYYLAEGCLTYDKEKDLYVTRITFANTEDELLNDVYNILNSLNIQFSTFKDPNFNALTIKIENKLFGEMLKSLNCGKDSYDVNIPDIFMFNEDYIRYNVLRGILLGDGGFSRSNENPGQFNYFSSSPVLFQQVQLLMHNIEVFPILSSNRKGYMEVNRIEELEKLKEMVSDAKKETLLNWLSDATKSSKSRKYTLEDGLCLTTIKDIQHIEKDEYVYSMEVPETENYITSSGVITHNCIGVDPYYLTYKAQQINYHPQVILAGRRVNDGMGAYVASQIVKKMSQNYQCIAETNILIMGYTFKENCPDIRNTKVIDIINELTEYGATCDVYDPWIADDEILPSNVNLIYDLEEYYESFDAVVLAVAHDEFKQMGMRQIRELCVKDESLVFDVKLLFPPSETDWRL